MIGCAVPYKLLGANVNNLLFDDIHLFWWTLLGLKQQVSISVCGPGLILLMQQLSSHSVLLLVKHPH